MNGPATIMSILARACDLGSASGLHRLIKRIIDSLLSQASRSRNSQGVAGIIRTQAQPATAAAMQELLMKRRLNMLNYLAEETRCIDAVYRSMIDGNG